MTADPQRTTSLAPVIFFLIVSATVIELALQAADAGLWSTSRLRMFIYQNAAFWPGLLKGWSPNYSAQPYTMFLTYAFLHGGLVHLIVNMITLVSLGMPVVRDVGQARFLVIYVISTLAGAIVFAVMTSSFRPMVGASGALFGLAGALVVWNARHTLAQDVSLAVKAASVLWPIFILLVLNALMYFGFDKNVAWETHLGGFLGGALAAVFMRVKDPSSPMI